MNVKKFILLLTVVLIIALTIASTASAAKPADDCQKAIIKFDKVSRALDNAKTTSPNALEAHSRILFKLWTEIAIACELY